MKLTKAEKKRLKQARRDRKIVEIKSKTRLTKAQAELYEAKARKKKAKRKASPFPRLPDVEVNIGQKRQGKRLSKRRRITL